MADKIRWGILSTARIGPRALIPAIHAANNGELVAVASRSLDKAQAFAAQHNIPKAYGSYEAMLADPDIDAIYNPLPNDGHSLWSIRAAEAGKSVLCEKPLAMDAADARHMVDAFKQHGRQLEEAFMYRFHPRTIRVKEMVDSGAVGDVTMLNGVFTFNMGPVEDIRLVKSMGGGGLMDIGCYAVGIMRFVLGHEPTDVHAYGQFNDDGVDINCAGILKFPTGALGHFDCGFKSQFAMYYDIRGTAGRIFVDSAFLPPRDGDAIIRYWHGDTYEEIKFPWVDQYQLMVEDFDDALLNNHPVRYPAEDGVLGMELLDKLRASAWANR
jgi:D-xylose 1-dehydrogenase (NADP+, D-xylono-1,5-lactone-forming)